MSHALSEPEPNASVLTLRGPHTLADLEQTPDDGRRYEIIGGWIRVTPAADYEHEDVNEALQDLLRSLLPAGVRAKRNIGVDLPSGDIVIPDIFVTTATRHDSPKRVAADKAHTVVEVVSPSNANNDRRDKWLVYAAAGIPCYWRIERERWPGYRGPLPALVVGLLRRGRWDETVYPPGTVADVPLVIGRRPGDVMIVKLDPATLLSND